MLKFTAVIVALAALGAALPQPAPSSAPAPVSFTSLCNIKCTVNLGDKARDQNHLCKPDVKASVQKCVSQLCDCAAGGPAYLEYDNLCPKAPKATYCPTRPTNTPTPPPNNGGGCPAPPPPTNTPVPMPRPICGGIAGLKCPSKDLVCVKDPKAPKGCRDCTGFCVPPTRCGGLIHPPCAQGEVCVDDPRDTCDPETGIQDCPGLCVAA